MTDEELFQKLPPEERKLRRKLGEALMRFMKKITEMTMDGLTEKWEEALAEGKKPDRVSRMDETMRRHVTENFRIEVERVARKGVECSLVWHTLGTWTEEGKERVGYFARALECIDEGRDNLPGGTPRPSWNDVHMRGDCLYEIGRVHAYEGDAAVARDFLLRALPLAQQAEHLQREAKVEHVDNLEGRIAELLVQLPDGPEEEKA